MPAYIPGTPVVASSSPVVVNTSGVDRFVLLHVAGSSSGSVLAYVDAGSTARPLAPWATVPQGESRDFGPYLVSAAYSVRYAAYPAVGAATPDEERP